MKRLFCAVLSAAFALTAVNAVSAEDKKDKDPEAVFKKLDTSGDGKLSVEEFVGKKKDEAAVKAKTAFAKKDKDGDGSLSLEEFKGKPKKKNDK